MLLLKGPVAHFALNTVIFFYWTVFVTFLMPDRAITKLETNDPDSLALWTTSSVLHILPATKKKKKRGEHALADLTPADLGWIRGKKIGNSTLLVKVKCGLWGGGSNKLLGRMHHAQGNQKSKMQHLSPLNGVSRAEGFRIKPGLLSTFRTMTATGVRIFWFFFCLHNQSLT